jgi:hypothetical protein
LFDAYKNYSKLPRETAYGHLNKSTLIIGESLGFSVYLLDKNTKKPSLRAKNVFCTIQNSTGTIIKKKMILSEEGVSSGIFEIDSLFNSGNYIFKAYTNWMRNFEEQNFYVQHIKIINPDQDSVIKADGEDGIDLDAQFLPESGHLVVNTKNTMGVVIKNNKGFGVANIIGTVLDSNGEEVTNFETNSHGISKFEYTPVSGNIYTVELNDEALTEITLDIGKAQGINMSLRDLNDKIALVFRTNEKTLPEIKNKVYKLAFGNGYQLKVIDVIFNDKTQIAKLISHSNLYDGINIITLFDENNKPVLERLYFKYDGISAFTTGTPSVEKLKDSLVISIPSASINAKAFNAVSVSVLPATTKSYNHHHNILSYTFLQPYVKGYIENARYYFTNIDRKKKSELDNLLLTQGWSSYDWTSIFNNPPGNQYEFEDGISINANLNTTKEDKFLIYPLQNTPSITVSVKDEERSFSLRGLLPVANEQLKIGMIDKKNRITEPSLYAQFSPIEIPNLGLDYVSLTYKNNVAFRYDASLPILDESWRKIETLDTILLSTKKEELRIEKIKRVNHGTVNVFNDIQRKTTPDLAAFLSGKGWVVRQDPLDLRSLQIFSNRLAILALDQLPPIIYLNDLIMNDFSDLLDIDMTTMDYIITDKQGLGEGFRGAGGVIKIYTNYMLRTREYNVSWDSRQEIEFPLTFSASKMFYAPIYSSYLNDFYQNYGVIDWFPKCESNDKGVIKLKVLNTKNKQLTLFIEGIANNGAFISEEKIIDIN